MEKPTPFLWFDTQAEDAMKFYCSVFKNAKEGVTHKTPDGKVMYVDFEINGQKFMGINAGPEFKFNEAVSFFINCEDQEEVDYLWDKLSSDGGEEGQCGWVKDKFGLWWQIIPKRLGELMGDPDPEKAKRANEAMLKMKKIIIKDLEEA